ncbi:MAG TPA: hypothetical protein VJN67_21155 [Stellaceae bacterium]|nr:hypothetical protein [Stellaceae bacterium]
MLTEDQVVDAVVAHLRKVGWHIQRTSTVNERGFDILAERNGKQLVVEAKGGGSGTKGTRRYGHSFTPNQKRNHVAMALLTAAKVVSKRGGRAAIALPSDEVYRKLVAGICPALKRLGIITYLVAPNRAVETIGAEVQS